MLPFFTKAQDSEYGAVEINCSYGISYLNLKELNSFSNSYNNYWGSDILKPMGKFSFPKTFGVAAGVVITFFYMEGGIKISSNTQYAELIDNTRQIIEFKDKMFKADMGFGLTREKYALHFYVPFEIGTSLILAKFQYADGTISSGFEQPLVGNYASILASRTGIGARYEKWFGFLGIFAKAECLFIAPKAATAEYVEDFGDAYYFYFPVDYKKFTNWGRSMDNAVHNRYKGFNTQLGVSINFMAFEK